MDGCDWGIVAEATLFNNIAVTADGERAAAAAAATVDGPTAAFAWMLTLALTLLTVFPTPTLLLFGSLVPIIDGFSK